MSQHAEQDRDPSGRESGAESPADRAAAPAGRPNFSGDLEEMLLNAPAFRRRLLGYDRLQVDNYVAWAESAQRTARQETDDLLDRYGRCWTELELAKRVLVHSPEGQQMAHVTERIGAMLELAADEAAEITTTATAEAQRLRAEARAESDAERREAKRSAEERARLDAEAAQVRDRLDREAAERRDRDTAAAAASIRQQFEEAREMEAAAEAAARQRLTRVEQEVADLEHRREVSRVALLRMGEQVREAVAALTETLPAPGLRLAPAPRMAAEDGPVTARHHARAREETSAS